MIAVIKYAFQVDRKYLANEDKLIVYIGVLGGLAINNHCFLEMKIGHNFTT